MRSRALIAIVATATVTVALVAFLQSRVEERARRDEERAARLEQEAQDAGRERLARQERRRAAREQEARGARERFDATRAEAAARAEDERRRSAHAERELADRQRQADERAREESDRRRAEDERRAEEARREAARQAERDAAEREREAAAAAAQRDAEERARREAVLAAEEHARKPTEAEHQTVSGDDDTPDVETETTVDSISKRRGWRVFGDIRPIVDGLREQARDGTTDTNIAPGVRARIGASFGITDRIQVGTRLATSGFAGDFSPSFVLPTGVTDSSELQGGETTFDQLFLLWKRIERFDLAVGRIQTRFVMRGGVYAKSLDRNDSHNTSVTWTDGAQANLRTGDWTSSLVVQWNSREGSGSIRRDPLDFDDAGARLSYFAGVENQAPIGPIVQRAFDVSYLPSALLKDGEPEGRRSDYWGAVGRLVVRWPPEKEGLRLRAGLEVAYAPETPTAAARNLPGSGDVGGLAWNIVASAIDFAPRHSIGVNYGRSDPGWLLSPQFRPNEELIEIRYMWRPERFPLFEPRIRRRREIDQQIGTVQRRTQYDFFVRLTWRFTIKD